MAKLSSNNRLDFGSPIGEVLSSRVILHRPDRKTVVLRRGKGGLLGLVGGKIHFRESSIRAATREVAEETGLKLSGALRLEGSLKMYDRTIWYPVSKYRELGFAFPLENCKPTDEILLWNPRAELYSGQSLTPLKDNQQVEGRDVVELNLEEENSLELVKPRHRMVLKAWRDFVTQGTPFPNVFVWKDKNSG